jgi:hypothetical protein
LKPARKRRLFSLLVAPPPAIRLLNYPFAQVAGYRAVAIMLPRFSTLCPAQQISRNALRRLGDLLVIYCNRVLRVFTRSGIPSSLLVIWTGVAS